MEIKDYSPYRPREILAMYENAGWSNYTRAPEMLRRAYENSLCALGAYEDGRLVGIIRAVGDGASVVFIQDLLVLSEYRRRGVGTALVRALAERYPEVYQFELLSDDTEGNAAFYSSLGFSRAKEYGCVSYMKMRRP